MTRPLLLLALLAYAAGCGGEPYDDPLLLQLNRIPGIVAVEDGRLGIERYYLLYVEEPLDHARPGGARFDLRVRLMVVDGGVHAPMVLSVGGYFLPEERKTFELTEMLHANQLTVEHRYFGESVPHTDDWTYLTVEQAVADLHRLNQLLRPLFDGKWVAKGGSKGGMTVLAYQYLYPGDVDATVAYVAPVQTSDQDVRLKDYLATRGTPECRQALLDVQRAMLAARSEMLLRLAGRALDKGHTYALMGLERAFDNAVSLLPWAFWQWGGSCEDIPPPTDEPIDLADYLLETIGLEHDEALLRYLPYFYQGATQMGWRAVDEAHIQDLLRFPGTDRAAFFAGFSKARRGAYDPSFMEGLRAWVPTAEHVLLVYGENDPWSGARVDIGPGRDSLSFTVPGGHHGSSFFHFDPEARAAVEDAFARWLGVHDIAWPDFPARRFVPLDQREPL